MRVVPAFTRSVKRLLDRYVRMLTVTVAVLVVVVGLPQSAHADPGPPTISADPAAIQVGQSATITVLNPSGGESVTLGLSDSSAGVLSLSDGQSGTSLVIPPSGIPIAAVFIASSVGEFSAVLGDGETVIASVIVTVVADDPIPDQEASGSASPGTATPSSTPSEATTSSNAASALLITWATVAVVLSAIAVIIALIATRRRRSSEPAEPAVTPPESDGR